MEKYRVHIWWGSLYGRIKKEWYSGGIWEIYLERFT